MSCPYNPASDGAEMDFNDKMSYGDYLQLDSILNSQTPLSEAHDEMLFIIQHQTSELWLKLAIHEMHATLHEIRTDNLRPAFKHLSRVSRIFEQLNSAWDVLRTMTPSEYTTFRDSLGQSSGFQSFQYRAIEFVVGNRNLAMLKPHDHDPKVTEKLEAILAMPSLYDETLLLLQRKGFNLSKVLDDRNWREKHSASVEVEEAWQQIYKDPEQHWALYELAEKLVDFEDYFRRWRFNHVTTVERIIGLKRGTGGTGGVSYLRRMLDTVLFPELWTVRTKM
ncbi:tryptophan 2,3-dioxygenase ['Osedax' symbiont bacterium Rs2_46_30_T18]|nr:tryptophan 2,3-dioxygenase ['Osedax' symbiont bacterium Rs2_46_30_T18]